MKKALRTVVRAGGALVLTAVAFSAAFVYAAEETQSLPGKGKTVTLFADEELSSVFRGVIIAEGLKKLGYDVEPLERLGTTVGWVATMEGSVDINVSAYLPNQNNLLEKGGEKVTRIGVVTRGSQSGYLIDKKTIEEYEIQSMEDLADPDIAKVFDRDGDGKADLVGCNPGWSCEKAIARHLQEYGLVQTVEQISAKYELLAADLVSRFRAGEPILYWSWVPHWLGHKLLPGRDVEYVPVTFSSLPEGADGKNVNPQYGFPSNNIEIVANAKWAARNPVAVKFLEQVRISMSDFQAVTYNIHLGYDTVQDVTAMAAYWLAINKDTFDKWTNTALEHQGPAQ